MQEEIKELLDTAIYKEIASQAFYEAGRKTTDDPGAKTLMEELAEEEGRHATMLKGLKDREWMVDEWHSQPIPNLMVSEHVTGGDTLEGGNLQQALVFAMKREQQAVEFYSRMTAVLADPDAKHLCEELVHEELKHKLKLETFYDDLFYQQD